MKALKEKRIRLRSLWRRGLVILSLFALVFVSCNSSDGGEGETTESTPPDPRNTVNVTVTGNPVAQYEGTEFDLTGITVTVIYDNNGTTESVTLDTPTKIKAYFRVVPQYIQGVILEDRTDPSDKPLVWVPVTEYTLFWKQSGGSKVRDFTGVTVIPIQRKLSLGSSTFEIFPVSGQFSPGNNSLSSGFTNEDLGKYTFYKYDLPRLDLGYVTNATINFTSNLDFLDDGVYVDENPNAKINKENGFKLQATYVDLKDKDIPLENTDIKFVTFYYNTSAGHNLTAPGELLVTINTNATVGAGDEKKYTALLANASFVNGMTYDENALGVASVNNSVAGKLTAMRYIPTVYHVKKVEVIKDSYKVDIKDPKTDLFMYYWEGEDDNDSGLTKGSKLWTDKLKAAGVKFNVWYTDGKDPQVKSLSDFETSYNVIWYNQNRFNPGASPNDDPYAFNQYNVFGVSGVTFTANQAKTDGKIKNAAWDKLPGAFADDVDALTGRYPAIRVEYRGAIAEVPVDIVNSVTEFTVVSYKEGSELEKDGQHVADMIWGRRPLNNDLGPLGAPKWDQLSYAAEAVLTLKLNSVRGNETIWTEKDLEAATASQGDFAQGGGDSAAAYNKFTTNFGVNGTWTNSESGTVFDPGSLNYRWTDAGWGLSGIKKNGPPAGAEKSVTFYYAPPKNNLATTITGKITNKSMKSSIPLIFKNIGEWEYYAGEGR